MSAPHATNSKLSFNVYVRFLQCYTALPTMSTNTFTPHDDIDWPTLKASGDEHILVTAKKKDGTEVCGVAVSFHSQLLCKDCLLNCYEDSKHYYKTHDAGTFKNHKDQFYGQNPKKLQPTQSAIYAAKGYPVPPPAAAAAAAAAPTAANPSNLVNLNDLAPDTAAVIR